MPRDYQGLEDKPNIATSEAAGGGKRKNPPSGGFQGRPEDDQIVRSEAVSKKKG